MGPGSVWTADKMDAERLTTGRAERGAVFQEQCLFEFLK